VVAVSRCRRCRRLVWRPRLLRAAVAVAFEGEDLGVVHESVDHGHRGDLVTEDLAQAEKGLLLVTIMEARS
jgi:hypothetical protein